MLITVLILHVIIKWMFIVFFVFFKCVVCYLDGVLYFYDIMYHLYYYLL